MRQLSKFWSFRKVLWGPNLMILPPVVHLHPCDRPTSPSSAVCQTRNFRLPNAPELSQNLTWSCSKFLQSGRARANGGFLQDHLPGCCGSVNRQQRTVLVKARGSKQTKIRCKVEGHGAFPQESCLHLVLKFPVTLAKSLELARSALDLSTNEKSHLKSDLCHP
jgi:hypothetical protein